MKKHEPIPKDYEVQPLKPNQPAEDRCTCGHCGLSWDDAICTGITPTPSGRCPFEYFHVYPEDKPKVKTVWLVLESKTGEPLEVCATKEKAKEVRKLYEEHPSKTKVKIIQWTLQK